MKLDFSELSDYFFDISDIYAVRQQASGSTRFIMQKPRATDGLLLFANTMGVCYQKGTEPLIVPQGALVYLPKDSHYVWENSPAENCDEQENLLFEFVLSRAEIFRGEKGELSHYAPSGEHISFGDYVTVVTTKHSELYKKLFYSLINSFCRPRFSPLSVYRSAYEIFDTLSGNCRIERENTADTRIIKDSIKYLESSDADLKSVKEIADECSVSVGYYEKLFKSFSGMTPVEYRNLHRINRIKMLLQTGKATLDEIAAQMGFCDSGYLCRFFKKNTGMTPKEYRKIYLQQTMPHQK